MILAASKQRRGSSMTQPHTTMRQKRAKRDEHRGRACQGISTTASHTDGTSSTSSANASTSLRPAAHPMAAMHVQPQMTSPMLRKIGCEARSMRCTRRSQCADDGNSKAGAGPHTSGSGQQR
jgi:hypothetical protein